MDRITDHEYQYNWFEYDTFPIKVAQWGYNKLTDAYKV